MVFILLETYYTIIVFVPSEILKRRLSKRLLDHLMIYIIVFIIIIIIISIIVIVIIICSNSSSSSTTTTTITITIDINNNVFIITVRLGRWRCGWHRGASPRNNTNKHT